MTNPTWTVRPLGSETWAAYARFVEASDAFPSGCWCMGFHPEGLAPRNGAYQAVNRERKRERVMAGTAHAALVFDGEDCIGWAQFGSPEEVPRIKSRAAYDKTLVDLPDWRIGCCFVGKGRRRQGVAHMAIEGALGLISRLGGGVVEGYPEPVGAVPAGFLFNGALSTYDQLGFERDRLIGKHRWVVRRVVEPA